MKTDYYVITIFNPVMSQDIKYRTLTEAKAAFLNFIRIGVRICSHFIYGRTYKDDNISLTYTAFYSDTQKFGKTKQTMYGRLIKQGNINHETEK